MKRGIQKSNIKLATRGQFWLGYMVAWPAATLMRLGCKPVAAGVFECGPGDATTGTGNMSKITSVCIQNYISLYVSGTSGHRAKSFAVSGPHAVAASRLGVSCPPSRRPCDWLGDLQKTTDKHMSV